MLLLRAARSKSEISKVSSYERRRGTEQRKASVEDLATDTLDLEELQRMKHKEDNIKD